MNVVFASMSTGKAIKETALVLDHYADRISRDSWKANLTEEALEMVRTLLSSRAKKTKTLAVACHWMRSSRIQELKWIVGRKSCFNEEGIVPVGYRALKETPFESRFPWTHLPCVKLLACMAALFHDIGKMNQFFQKKISAGKMTGDPWRHEWVSCKIIESMYRDIGGSDDRSWLSALSSGNGINHLLKIDRIPVEDDGTDVFLSGNMPSNFPPILSVILWLVLSHHRIPTPPKDSNFLGFPLQAKNLSYILSRIPQEWSGYYKAPEKKIKKYISLQMKVFQKESFFPVWEARVRKTAENLLSGIDMLEHSISTDACRLLLIFSHVCLVHGDHVVSGTMTEDVVEGANIASTDRKTGAPVQSLSWHLVKVSKMVTKIARQLPRIQEALPVSSSHRSAVRNIVGTGRYEWQEIMSKRIRSYRHDTVKDCHGNFIVFSMASTGRGKTLGYAKAMQELSLDGNVRYTVVLSLRTLTWQTGDAYAKRLGIPREDLAVVAGTKAMQELYMMSENEDSDGQSLEILNGYLRDESAAEIHDTVAQIFPCDGRGNSRGNERMKKEGMLLNAPIAIMTIDHIIGATEGIRGGQDVLPILRLLSSDLVLDEVDDYDTNSLFAVMRLVHLAGMLGRNVLASSASIAPSIVYAMVASYREGQMASYSFFGTEPKALHLCLSDEFSCRIRSSIKTSGAETVQDLSVFFDSFMKTRVEKLAVEPARHIGEIVSLSGILSLTQQKERVAFWYEACWKACSRLHTSFHMVDEDSKKRISFGVIRVANIRQCVGLGWYLMNRQEDAIDVRVMVYHARQTAILRHKQEQYLDMLFQKCASERGTILKDSVVRSSIASSSKRDIIFVVVATPVEEIGRDHDFDWAVIEPSSFRSILQMSGRVLRHRFLSESIKSPNIGILQYNFKAIESWDTRKKSFRRVVYARPGYEMERDGFYFPSDASGKDMNRLLPSGDRNPIVATPRIRFDKRNKGNLQKLSDLEHIVLSNLLDIHRKDAECLPEWFRFNSFIWLTGFSQQVRRFRDNDGQIEEKVSYVVMEDGTTGFCNPEDGKYAITRTDIYPYQKINIGERGEKRLWYPRNFVSSIEEMVAKNGSNLVKSLEYGEIVCRKWDTREAMDGWVPATHFYSDEFGLLGKRDLECIRIAEEFDSNPVIVTESHRKD